MIDPKLVASCVIGSTYIFEYGGFKYSNRKASDSSIKCENFDLGGSYTYPKQQWDSALAINLLFL